MTTDLHINDSIATTDTGRAMAQDVNRRLLVAEATFQNQICGGQSGHGVGFSLSTSDATRPYHSNNAPYLCFIYRQQHITLYTACVIKQKITPTKMQKL